MQIEQSELDNIIKMRNEYGELTMQYGSLELAKRSLLKEQDLIAQKFDELKVQEDVFLAELQIKYGMGNLDIVNGEFTPMPEQTKV